MSKLIRELIKQNDRYQFKDDEAEALVYIYQEIRNAYRSIQNIQYELRNVQDVLERHKESSYDDMLEEIIVLKQKIDFLTKDTQEVFDVACYIKKWY